MIKLLISISLKDVNIFIESFPKLDRIYSRFPLHSILDTILLLCLWIVKVEGSKTLIFIFLRVVSNFDIMHTLCSSERLSRLKVHGSDATLSRMPMLYIRHSVDWRAKWFFETSRLVEVRSSANWSLIRKLEAYVEY